MEHWKEMSHLLAYQDDLDSRYTAFLRYMHAHKRRAYFSVWIENSRALTHLRSMHTLAVELLEFNTRMRMRSIFQSWHARFLTVFTARREAERAEAAATKKAKVLLAMQVAYLCHKLSLQRRMFHTWLKIQRQQVEERQQELDALQARERIEAGRLAALPPPPPLLALPTASGDAAPALAAVVEALQGMPVFLDASGIILDTEVRSSAGRIETPLPYAILYQPIIVTAAPAVALMPPPEMLQHAPSSAVNDTAHVALPRESTSAMRLDEIHSPPNRDSVLSSVEAVAVTNAAEDDAEADADVDAHNDAGFEFTISAMHVHYHLELEAVIGDEPERPSTSASHRQASAASSDRMELRHLEDEDQIISSTPIASHQSSASSHEAVREHQRQLSVDPSLPTTSEYESASRTEAHQAAAGAPIFASSTPAIVISGSPSKGVTFASTAAYAPRSPARVVRSRATKMVIIPPPPVVPYHPIDASDMHVPIRTILTSPPTPPEHRSERDPPQPIVVRSRFASSAATKDAATIPVPPMTSAPVFLIRSKSTRSSAAPIAPSSSSSYAALHRHHASGRGEESAIVAAMPIASVASAHERQLMLQQKKAREARQSAAVTAAAEEAAKENARTELANRRGIDAGSISRFSSSTLVSSTAKRDISTQRISVVASYQRTAMQNEPLPTTARSGAAEYQRTALRNEPHQQRPSIAATYHRTALQNDTPPAAAPRSSTTAVYQRTAIKHDTPVVVCEPKRPLPKSRPTHTQI
jgi:hypothetical protein